MKKQWIRWVLPGTAVLLLDRLVKGAKMWSARSYGNGDIAGAPLPLRLFGKVLDALAQLFWPSGTPGEELGGVTRNSGMAFGMFQGGALVILLVSVLLLAGCFFLLRGTRPSGLAPIAISMILGGALGNMIDRIAYGYVIDMIPFFGWFEFNVADAGVVAGAVLCGISLLFRPGDWSNKEK